VRIHILLDSYLLSLLFFFFSVLLAVKFENALFANTQPQSEVKLIDFGLSKKYLADQTMSEGVGTVSRDGADEITMVV